MERSETVPSAEQSAVIRMMSRVIVMHSVLRDRPGAHDLTTGQVTQGINSRDVIQIGHISPASNGYAKPRPRDIYRVFYHQRLANGDIETEAYQLNLTPNNPQIVQARKEGGVRVISPERTEKRWRRLGHLVGILEEAVASGPGSENVSQVSAQLTAELFVTEPEIDDSL